jgi:hypothetical protein
MEECCDACCVMGTTLVCRSCGLWVLASEDKKVESSKCDHLTYRGSCNAKKKKERGSGVDWKFNFLNRYSYGRSETVDAKISSKRDRFTIHMLDSEVG